MRSAIINIFNLGDVNKTLDIGENKYNINVQSSGTTTGVRKALDKTSDFVLASQNTDKWSKNKKYRDKWEANKLKTISIAQDAIVILYKAPKGCEEEMVVSKDTTKNIYSYFSGHKYPGVENKYSSLLPAAAAGVSRNSSCDAPIKAFSKTGGETKSGTSYAFIHYNPLFVELRKEIEKQTDESDKTPKLNTPENQAWLKKVLSSNYGSDFDGQKTHLLFTQENSILSYQYFLSRSTDDEGSLIYLPASFAFANWSDIKANGLKLATFKKDETTTSDLTKENLQTEVGNGNYSWVRNLNIVYSVKNVKQFTKDIVNYIISKVDNLAALHFLPIKFVDDEGSEQPTTPESETIAQKSYKKSQLFIYDPNDCNKDGWMSNNCKDKIS